MRRSRLFLLAGFALLLIAVVGLWQWRGHERDGSAALARGLAALDKGDARVARVELMNAIKAAPRSAAAHRAQARALVLLGDGAGAEAEVERTRALGAPAADTRAVMAEALLLQGNAAAAAREAEALDVPDGDRDAADRMAARAALAQDDPRTAQRLLARLLQRAPADVQAWVDLGRLRLAVGDQAGAIAAADHAVALSPNSARALTLRAELTRAQYGLSASLPWFDRALVADPASVPTMEQYAATLADAGQAGRMLALTRRILALDPGNPRALLMQAVMAARADRPDLARALLDRTQGRLDEEPATRLLRGTLHLADGNAVLAAEALAPLVAAQPDNRTARTLLGRAQLMAGDAASAAATLAPAVAQRDAGPYILTLAARAQEMLGHRAMAGDMLARAAWPVRAATDSFASPRDAIVASGPAPADPATAHDNIPYIRALMRAGRTGQAVARARLLSDANPGAPAAWLILGDTFDLAGRPGDAARAYESAANIRFDRAAALRLAAAWGRAGDSARAAQVVQLFLAQNPTDPDMLRVGAAMAMERRDWRGALRMLQAVRAQLGDADALLMADLSRAALETGDRIAARAYAAHAYRLMPANPVTADALGWVLLNSGADAREAVDLLEKAVALAPAQPVLRQHLSRAYAAVGRTKEARLVLSTGATTPES
ncbi:tetratricopeptide (TPR) repeat protein [Sphingobium sp. OAS761]|uniref:tetratricopeptide repeat protein n=1 Tax=Sphingobium sp. OAS761 TaxID=2817901 RepID=UPI00209E39F6|nr:tetratricopeptide repeat protein [Sphingobium sp. OAS761]MCP1468773.1 tetratricopeptide (TPR) repeat protein [Sphingobium sp. OAS761]